MILRAAVAMALVGALAAPARAGDPRRAYYTVESAHFTVHYWAPHHALARRVAVVAERAYRTLTVALDHVPVEKIIVSLADDTDSANGFASVLPRNQITVYATAPGSFSELDDHDDWLYNLVAHELTHILHLDTIAGVPAIYNRIFGKTWAPNQTMPRWLIEGIAVYEESKRSASGRNRGSRFEQIIRISRHSDDLLRLDEVTGAPRRFPRGNTAYVYGSHFLRYVFDRFGEDTLRQMSHVSGGHPVPYALNRPIAKIAGQPFTSLYRDWTGYLRDRYGLQEMAAERRGLAGGRALTFTGENNVNPAYSADGTELFWQQADGYTEPRVRAMPVGGDARAARDIVSIDGMGPFALAAGNSLVYEQGRVYRREYQFQDLFLRDGATADERRLTTGARARDPALSPDGRSVAFSMNRTSHSVLATMAIAPGAAIRVVWEGGPRDQVYQPAWSPDGTRIAFSAWREGGRRDIVVLDLAAGTLAEITNDRAIDMSPEWSRDGRWLFFDSDRTGISNIYAYDLRDRALWQVTNVLGGAFRPALSPDGTRLAFQSAVPSGGYDLYELRLEPARWLPARPYLDDRPPVRVIRDDEVAVTAPRRYRAVETLAPRSWEGELRLGDVEPTASITTRGSDAVGLHSYQLTVTGRDDGTLGLGALYGYSGLAPNLRVAGSRSVNDRSGYRIDGVAARYRSEDYSATVSASVPFESRPFRTWSLALDYDVDWFRQVGVPLALPDEPDPSAAVTIEPVTDYVQAGVGLRVAYSSVRGVTYGVGPQRGWDASVGLRFDHPALGATFRNITVNYATTAYQRLWGRTPVLAARLTGGFRAGELVRSGGFALGGVPQQDVVQSIVDSLRAGATGYLRGYPGRTVVGNQFHLLNAEYRQELLQIERGLGTLPIYMRRVHLALLLDSGTAFDTAFDVDRDLRVSAGAAVRLDALFGWYSTGTFEIGYSRGLTDEGIGESWFLLTGTL